ncbi:hypothetical protein C4561_05735 [candidate division WWE3 bacterium]|jgi:hypothetical protein|uniref:Uncharacterized protein n=1 Tax=candidate division WWE3 bacterium TaxID=2053526 RepID=A0A3A4ZA34_UNCKA|nr:MAG: hypothetical protein C4561_05735 [candidate division WWE3 bacterium]
MQTIFKKKYDLLFILVFFILNTFLLKDIIFTSGTIGIKSDWPIPPLKEQIESLVIHDVFYSWSPNYLGYERVRQSGNYVDLATYLIVRAFGVGGEVVSKYPLALLYFVGPVAYIVLRRFKFLPFAAFSGAAFYTYCVPFLYDFILNGYLKFIFTYLFFPVFTYFLYQLLTAEHKSTKDFFLLSLSSVLVSTSLNFFFICAIASFLGLLVFSLSKTGRVKSLITNGILLGFVYGLTVLVHATAFFPPLYDVIRADNGETVNKLKTGLITFLTFSHPSSVEAFRLFGVIDNYFERSYPVRTEPISEVAFVIHLFYYFGLFLLVFVGFFTSRKRSNLESYLLILLVTGVFIFKGVNPPFGYINLEFYKVPLMSVLRNISYIAMILAFPYAYFFGKGTHVLMDKVSGSFMLKYSIPVLLMITLVFGSYPLWSAKILSDLKSYKLKREEINIYEYLRDNESRSNIFFVPGISPFVYFIDNYETVGPGFNPLMTNPPKPTLSSNVVNFNNSHYLSVFLNNYLAYEDNIQLTDILKVANVSHIWFDSNFESVYSIFINLKDNKWYKSHISLESLERKLGKSDLIYNPDLSGGRVALIEVPEFRDSYITAIDNLFLNVGGYEAYINNSFIGLMEPMNGVFARDYEDFLIDDISFIGFSNADYDDLLFGLVSLDTIYQPANFIEKNRNKPQKEWTPLYHGQYWWYDPLLSNTDESMIIVEKAKNASFDIPLNLNKGSEYSLYAKVLVSSDGGELVFRMDGGGPFTINTQSDNYKGFKYFEVGKIRPTENNPTLKIISRFAETNVLSEVIVLTNEQLNKAKSLADRLIASNPLVYTLNKHDSHATGKNLPINDFYYARKSTKQDMPYIVNILKANEYKVFVKVEPEYELLEEVIIPDGFTVLKKEESYLQRYSLKTEFDNLEYCYSFTYFDSVTNKPALRIPKDPLFVRIYDAERNLIQSNEIRGSKIYSEGDWFTNCEEFEVSNDKGMVEFFIEFSSLNTETRWAIATGIEEDTKQVYPKSRISGMKSEPLTILSLSVDGKKLFDKSVPAGKSTHMLGDVKFEEGSHSINIGCREFCDASTLILAPKDLVIVNSVSYIEAKELNPLKYSFSIASTEGKDLLVHKESYSPNWKIANDKNRNSKHFKINGYQNAWKISNVNEDPEDIIEIAYSKQDIYSFSNKVSFFAIVIIICGICSGRIIKFFKKAQS